MSVTMPWPPRDLSPNARLHWSRKARAAKKYRHDCWALALAAFPYRGRPVFEECEEIHVWMTYLPPDKRHRDLDNCLASSKALLDGLADALGVNDRRFRLHPYLSDKVIKGGAVEVRLSKGPQQ